MSREASSGESRFARLERLFHRLRDVDATARAALLALEGEIDAQLRAELDAMLDAHDRDAPIVEESVLVEAVRELATHAPFTRGGDGRHASPLPESIGEYRIVRVLGEGGMGVVYEAEQRQPRRRVALKVVRGDLLLGPSRQERLRRFAREVEALGRLEHPAIARVYAAGEAAVATELGRSSLAYVAMELVEGRPLTEGTATRLGNARQRMELLAKVCDGVAAAHVAGIVHRDLKPANILVTSAGEPKILDFGIARIDREAERGAGRTRSLHTEAGQLLGTVPYMSPEQFGGDSDHVDARSDVYALGVIAFELLTDRLPIDVRSLALADAARAIRDDPPKRLGDVEPACRGDLETIVAKALEKDPDRRYANAAAFGDDIRRWLRHEPIVARPATAIYQMRTFARRHRTLVGATLAVIAVLVAASITLSVFWIRERDQRAKAEAANRELERQAYRATLAAARSAVKASEFTAAARHLALASEPLRGWEWRYLARQHAPALATVAALPGAIVAIQISDDGRRLFAVDDAGHGAVVDRASFHVVWRVDVPVAPSAQILVDPRGERFIVRAGGTVRGFATSDRQLFQWPFDRTFSPHPSDVAAPEFLATDLGGGDLLRFDARTGEAIGSPRRDRTFAHAWTNSRGQLIAWEKQRESTGIVDEPGGWRRPGRVIGASTTRDQALLFTPDRLEAIDTRDGAVLSSLRGPFGVDDGFALDRTGRRIAVSKAGDVTHVELLGEPFDAFVGRYGADSRRSADLWGRIACFAPDDDLLFTGAADGAIRAWVPRHQPLWRLPGRNVNRAAFSPDGQTLATARWGTVRLFDTATGRQQWSKVVHRNEIFHIAWSPDGRSLLTGDERGNIRVLDAADGVVRVDWACAAGRFDAVGWMHDGRILALAGVARAASKPSTAGKRFVCDPVAPDETTDDSETDLVGPIERDSLAGRTAVGTREGGIRWLDEPGGRDGPSPPPLHPPAGHRQPLDWILIDRARQQVLAGAGRSLLRWPLPAGPSTEGTNAPIVATAVRGDLLRTEAATLSPDGSRLFIADRGGGVRVLDAEQLESIVSLEVEGLDAIDIAWRDDESLLVSGGEVLLAALETGPSEHASERAARSESIGVVGALFDAHRTVERVRGAIESHLLERAHELGLSAGDPGLTALRDELLRSAEEHGNDPNLLNSEAWKLLRSTEGALGAPSAEDRRRAHLALEYVAISRDAFPQDHAILNTWALAFVRCGRSTEALAALDRCDALARASRGTVDPFDLVVRAMAHVVAGDRHAARLQREEVQRLAPEPSDGDLRAFLAELDAALAPPGPSAASAGRAAPTEPRSGASTGGDRARRPPDEPLRTQAPPASSQSPDPTQQRAN